MNEVAEQLGQQNGASDVADTKVDTSNEQAQVDATVTEQDQPTVAASTEKVEEAVKKEDPSDAKDSYWGKDWREQMIKESGITDEAEMSAMRDRLSRFASPSALTKSYVELSKKVSSGDIGKAPEDPEALARWRSENGIPEKFEDYDLTFEDGMVLGEDMMPLVNPFLETAHKHNLKPEVVRDIIADRLALENKIMGQEIEAFKQHASEATAELKEEWGDDYEVNTKAIANLAVSKFGEELANDITDAVLPNGKRLGDTPAFARGMVDLSRELNIGDLVVPGSINSIESIKSEKAQIESKMGTTAYTNEDRARYTQLVDAEEKLSSRQR